MERKATSGNEKTGMWMTVKRILAYLMKQRGRLAGVLLLVVASSALGLLGPFIIGRTIDSHLNSPDARGLAFTLSGLGLVYLGYSLALWLQNYWMIGMAQQTVCLMRKQLFEKLHKLPIRFFDKRQHGELMSRVSNDIENVSSTLNSSVIQVASSLLTLTGTLAVMLWLSPLLTLVTMTIVPLMFFGMKWITSRTGKLYKQQQGRLGDLNGFIEETISGQKVIKTFSQEERVMTEFLEKSGKLKEAGYWAQVYGGFIPKLMNMLNNLSFTFVAAAGGVFALNGWVSIGTIVIFTEYSRQFTRPLNDLSNQFNTLLSAVAGAERVFDILDEKEEDGDEENAREVRSLKGAVEFRKVSFAYEQGGDTVKELDFKVHPGESIALVGPTGAGKSTIINLITRFYEPDSGAILVDGIDHRRIKRSSLRSQMGFVLQDPFLFNSTIMENIRYGRLAATDKEVEEAAAAANALSFIERLPAGFKSVLNEEGATLSQGQKQLLSIARAILADPAILILDEATSSIDTITEIKIQKALKKLMHGRTSFIIAHRLNTIMQADKILVIDGGKINEMGTHQELMRKKGFYHDLYQTQFKAEKAFVN